MHVCNRQCLRMLYNKLCNIDIFTETIYNERKSEQAHIPHAPTLLENANEWQFQALVTGNRTENQFHLSYTK